LCAFLHHPEPKNSIVAALCSEAVPSIEDFVRTTNLLVPCCCWNWRQKRHIEVDFPANPAAPDAQFKVPFVPLILNLERETDSRSDSYSCQGTCWGLPLGDELKRRRVEESLMSQPTGFSKYLA
jgi:hypothetical protein